ncbi:MAG: hypothetical protein AB4042_17270 [Leptolyngbyaceae cyanobacterium]
MMQVPQTVTIVLVPLRLPPRFQVRLNGAAIAPIPNKSPANPWQKFFSVGPNDTRMVPCFAMIHSYPLNR